MSVLRNLEAKLTDLVEGTFGRVFRSEVRPVELARKLAREMDEHKTVSVSRTYVPNEYVVYLSPEDRERLEGVEDSLIEELSALPARARAHGAPRAAVAPADRVPHRRAPGARRVRHPGAARAPVGGPGRRRARAGRSRQHDDLLDRRPAARAGRGSCRAHAPDRGRCCSPRGAAT